jgi:hypothetical protein
MARAMGPMAQHFANGKPGDSESPLDNIMKQIPQRNGPDELGLRKQSDISKAIYGKTVQAGRMLDHIREELDKLTNMADTVTPGDVIGAAGRLVGHGIPAKEMATLLADMPTNAGQGLAAWVQMHDQNARQQEAEVARITSVARYQMGLAALRELAGEHILDSRVRPRRAAAAQMGGQLALGGGGMPQTTVLQMAQPPTQPAPMGRGAEEAT